LSLQSLLSIQGVSRSFGQTQALQNVSVDFSEGVNGILGPNGAGKTTLFRVLTGVLQPSSGDVFWQGKEIKDRRWKQAFQRQVGYLPQDPGWFEGFTVKQLCHYFAGLRQVPRGVRAQRIEHAIDSVGLSEQAGTSLKALSGGQRRRAFIAQTLIHDPSILVLDEPTSGLDPVQRVQIRELVATLGRERVVLLSTHLVEDIAQTARNIVILDSGRLVWAGAPEELSRLGGHRGNANDSVTTAYERGFLAMLEETSNV